MVTCESWPSCVEATCTRNRHAGGQSSTKEVAGPCGRRKDDFSSGRFGSCANTCVCVCFKRRKKYFRKRQLQDLQGGKGAADEAVAAVRVAAPALPQPQRVLGVASGEPVGASAVGRRGGREARAHHLVRGGRAAAKTTATHRTSWRKKENVKNNSDTHVQQRKTAATNNSNAKKKEGNSLYNNHPCSTGYNIPPLQN
jgi:hypothetical protein